MDGLENMIDGLQKMAAESNPPEQGDYIVDGLLYCHKCNTPKQTRVTFFFGDRTVSCLCKCEAEKLKAEEDERKRKELQKTIDKFRSIGFPESQMQYWNFENDDGTNERITTAAKNYAINFDRMLQDGKGLLLYGTVGTGKTYAAACIANELIDKGIPCLVTNFARIANTVQGLFEGKQEYYDSLNRFKLLVIDDLSAERKTEYMQEIVYNVIDSRYRAGLPIIVTTNLTSDEIKHPADITYSRTFSRLMEMTIPLEVTGKDRRKEKLKDTFSEYKNLLGI